MAAVYVGVVPHAHRPHVVVAHAWAHDGGGIERVRHEGEDGVQGEGAYGRETVDVSEMEFSGEEQEGAEEGEEEDWAGEV